jgi:hypothetical protein
VFDSYVCRFAYECSLLCAQDQSWLQRRKLKSMARSKPYTAIGRVVRQGIADPSADWLPDLFAAAEAALALDREALTEFVAVGLFEGFQNVASHSDVDIAMDPFAALLGAASLGVWASVVAHWNEVAEQVDFDAPDRFTQARYENIDHVELRAWVQDVYRRMPDGHFVGLADVIRFEANHGGGPHVDKARR